MAIRLSSGLKAALYGNFGISAMLQYGSIEVYSGTQPATADDAPTGTYLGRITQNGLVFTPGSTGDGALLVGLDAFGQLAKSGTWTFNGEATGTAGWWRWRWNAIDDGEVSLYHSRIDGLVGDSLVLANTAITPSSQFDINSFLMQFLED